eukprot:1205974-Pleurochrysis_carterae.AAC.1
MLARITKHYLGCPPTKGLENADNRTSYSMTHMQDRILRRATDELVSHPISAALETRPSAVAALAARSRRCESELIKPGNLLTVGSCPTSTTANTTSPALTPQSVAHSPKLATVLN